MRISVGRRPLHAVYGRVRDDPDKGDKPSMSDDLYTDDDSNEEQDESAPQPSNREAAATRLARKAEREAAEAKLELAIYKAGIDGLNERQLNAIKRELADSEATPDAVKQVAQELGFAATPQVAEGLSAHQAISQTVATPTAPPPSPTPAAQLQEVLQQIVKAPPGRFATGGADPALMADARKAIEAAGLEWGDVEAIGDFEPI